VPYDLAAVERGYGECECEWENETIVLRYRAELNNRALIAVKRALVGVLALDGKTRFPDVETMIEELERVLLPSGPDVPADERGWDITDNGASVPITFDTLADLPPGLPAAMLGAVFRDVNDPNRRRPSSSGSSVAASSEGRPTITRSSAPRNGRASLPGRSGVSSTRAAGTAGNTG
jgi:hypothetical protein